MVYLERFFLLAKESFKIKRAGRYPDLKIYFHPSTEAVA